MISTRRLAILASLGGFFVLLDQVAKFIARVHPWARIYIWRPWLGWEYLRNTGIAFSLPIPQSIVIFFTPLIILALCMSILKERRDELYSLALILITSGAVSNFIDRVLWAATIDYIRIFTGVINLADMMIAGGLILLFFLHRKI